MLIEWTLRIRKFESKQPKQILIFLIYFPQKGFLLAKSKLRTLKKLQKESRGDPQPKWPKGP